MNIEVTSAAERHLQAAGRFYEQQSPGLGDYFLDSLMADIESLHIYAGIHAVYFERYHRLLVGQALSLFRVLPC